MKKILSLILVSVEPFGPEGIVYGDKVNVDCIAFELFKPIRHDEPVIWNGNSGQRHSVCCIGIGANGLSDHVDHPVLRFAFADKGIERPCCSPHDVAS